MFGFCFWVLSAIFFFRSWALQILPLCICEFSKVWWSNIAKPDFLSNSSSKNQTMDDCHSLWGTNFGGCTLKIYFCSQNLQLELFTFHCFDRSWRSILNTTPILDSLVSFVYLSKYDMFDDRMIFICKILNLDVNCVSRLEIRLLESPWYLCASIILPIIVLLQVTKYVIFIKRYITTKSKIF